MTEESLPGGPDPDLMVVAELSRPHGIRGEVTARLSGVEGEDLSRIPLRLRLPRGEPRGVRVLRARRSGAGWILAIEGIADRGAAETLRGSVLLAARADLPEPGPGEWYVRDLIGLRVVDAEAGEIGRLEEVLKLPANDVFVVRGRRGEVLVPVLQDVVLEVDGVRGVLDVRLPAGLLDPPGDATGESE